MNSILSPIVNPLQLFRLKRLEKTKPVYIIFVVFANNTPTAGKKFHAARLAVVDISVIILFFFRFPPPPVAAGAGVELELSEGARNASC